MLRGLSLRVSTALDPTHFGKNGWATKRALFPGGPLHSAFNPLVAHPSVPGWVGITGLMLRGLSLLVLRALVPTHFGKNGWATIANAPRWPTPSVLYTLVAHPSVFGWVGVYRLDVQGSFSPCFHCARSHPFWEKWVGHQAGKMGGPPSGKNGWATKRALFPGGPLHPSLTSLVAHPSVFGWVGVYRHNAPAAPWQWKKRDLPGFLAAWPVNQRKRSALCTTGPGRRL